MFKIEAMDGDGLYLDANLDWNHYCCLLVLINSKTSAYVNISISSHGWLVCLDWKLVNCFVLL